MMPLSSSRYLSFKLFLVLLISSSCCFCSYSDHRGVGFEELDHVRRSIYDVLQSNGLPIGILPKGISDFKVDEGGNFEVHLEEACNAKFETQVRYEKNISGVLSFGQIVGLSGISAQELFLWFPVKVIRVDIPSSGLIYFDVGVIYKQFSLSLFETPPDCTAAADNNNQVSQYQLHEGKEMVDVVFKNDKEKFQDYVE